MREKRVGFVILAFFQASGPFWCMLEPFFPFWPSFLIISGFRSPLLGSFLGGGVDSFFRGECGFSAYNCVWIILLTIVLLTI